MRDRAHEVYQAAREAYAKGDDLEKYSNKLVEMRKEAYYRMTEEKEEISQRLQEVQNAMEPCVSDVIDEILTLSNGAAHGTQLCVKKKLKSRY